MDANFKRLLVLVLRHEGGFVNHPADPGGATNKGITIATFRRYVKSNATVADLKAITPAQIEAVYYKGYWSQIMGPSLPAGVDYAVFDFAVNSGPSRAAKYLQAVVGAKQDGKIGPATLAAVAAMDPATIVARLCDNRLAFLKRLKTWAKFGKGWASRVAAVRSEALRMAAQKTADAPAPILIPEPAKPAETAPQAAADGFWAAVAELLLKLFGGAK